MLRYVLGKLFKGRKGIRLLITLAPLLWRYRHQVKRAIDMARSARTTATR